VNKSLKVVKVVNSGYSAAIAGNIVKVENKKYSARLKVRQHEDKRLRNYLLLVAIIFKKTGGKERYRLGLMLNKKSAPSGWAKGLRELADSIDKIAKEVE